MDRRQLLGYGASILTMRMAPAVTFVAAAASLASGAARAVEPVTVLAAANVALSVMSAFSGSGGGLSAMLRAQAQMLGLISSQLNAIHAELARLSTSIKDLGERVEMLFSQSYRDAQIYEIGASAQLYGEMLSAYERNPNYFKSTEVQEQLRALLTRANGSRARLAMIGDGVGPEAALVIPVASGLEIACMVRLGFPTDGTIVALKAYEKWCDSCLDDGPYAIPARHAQAVKDFAAEFTKAKESRFGKLFNVDQYPLPTTAEKSPRNDAIDVCVGFAEGFKGEPALISKKHIEAALAFAAWHPAGGSSYERCCSTLSLKNQEGVGLPIFDYEPGGLRVTSVYKRNKVDGFFPRSDDCYMEVAKRQDKADEIIEYVEKKSAAGKKAFAEVDEFVAALRRLDQHRFRVALATRASSVVSEARTRLVEQREFLERGR